VVVGSVLVSSLVLLSFFVLVFVPLAVFVAACSDLLPLNGSGADKMLERGDALEQVARKAREIEEAGQDFKKVTVPFKRKAMCKNLKATICLCCLCTLLSPSPFSSFSLLFSSLFFT
jgi:hypothetical protein